MCGAGKSERDARRGFPLALSLPTPSALRTDRYMYPSLTFLPRPARSPSLTAVCTRDARRCEKRPGFSQLKLGSGPHIYGDRRVCVRARSSPSSTTENAREWMEFRGSRTSNRRQIDEILQQSLTRGLVVAGVEQPRAPVRTRVRGSSPAEAGSERFWRSYFVKLVITISP